MFRHLFITLSIVAAIYLGLLIVIDHPFVVGANELPTKLTKKENDLSAVKNEDNDQESRTIIFGLSKSIDLSNPGKDVRNAWAEFTENQSLQNNVDWSKGKIRVYAYFYDFNESMSSGMLAIGYDGNDLLLHTKATSVSLPQGELLKFKFNSQTGTAEYKAWESAYRYKNLIERHILDANGEVISSDVIVIK